MASDEIWREDLETRDPELFKLLQEMEQPATARPQAVDRAKRQYLHQRILMQQLYQARRQQGLTQRDLAEQLNMQQSSIARLESGKSNPSLKTLLAVVEALNVQLTLQPKPDNLLK